MIAIHVHGEKIWFEFPRTLRTEATIIPLMEEQAARKVELVKAIDHILADLDRREREQRGEPALDPGRIVYEEDPYKRKGRGTWTAKVLSALRSVFGRSESL